MNVRLFGEAFVTLFVIMDPPGTVPLFLALTSLQSSAARSRAAWQAVAVAVSVITVFAVAGQQILAYLSISLPALQGAGGLLLLLVALQLLTGTEKPPEQVADVNVALVPLGTPLLAGPGAIVATIVFTKRATSLADYLAIAAAIVAVHLALYLFLRFSTVIVRIVRDSGIVLITKISGLLVSAIAVQLIASSVYGFVENHP
ncbi:MarC family protein [Fodinicola acaciae]|uniref:MarC family protein n=1 Tax=Fodinicola acaciae TaxID=2681555 RepID=UPI0013D27E8D|nr:MarC family protein [Fodinicola acaciae]